MGAARLDAIAALRTPEQLHQFALNFDPNDDPLVCVAVVEHPACDHGTAVFLLWQFADFVLRPEAPPPRYGHGFEAFSRIRDILSSRHFRTADFSYDALDEHGYNVVGRRQVAALGLLDAMLRCRGTIRVTRQEIV